MLRKNCTVLSQSESSNIFMYIITGNTLDKLPQPIPIPYFHTLHTKFQNEIRKTRIGIILSSVKKVDQHLQFGHCQTVTQKSSEKGYETTEMTSWLIFCRLVKNQKHKSLSSSVMISLPKIVTLTWWGCLCAPMSPRAMLAGPLEVLVGTPMPDRSKVRGQTKSNLPALQVWGFCIGLTTLSCKKLLLRKNMIFRHCCANSLF